MASHKRHHSQSARNAIPTHRSSNDIEATYPYEHKKEQYLIPTMKTKKSPIGTHSVTHYLPIDWFAVNVVLKKAEIEK
jgi:hypothetical protein